MKATITVKVKKFSDGERDLYLAIEDCYQWKDELKAIGYRWDGMAKEWYLMTTKEELKEQTIKAIAVIGKANVRLHCTNDAREMLA